MIEKKLSVVTYAEFGLHIQIYKTFPHHWLTTTSPCHWSLKSQLDFIVLFSCRWLMKVKWEKSEQAHDRVGAHSPLSLCGGSRPPLLLSILLHDLVEERVLFTSPTCSKKGQDGEDIKLYKGKQKVLVWLTPMEFLHLHSLSPFPNPSDPGHLSGVSSNYTNGGISPLSLWVAWLHHAYAYS